MEKDNTTCPKCKNNAKRILFQLRYYIYCPSCGCNTIAKIITSTGVAKTI